MDELFEGVLEADKIRILRQIDGSSLVYKKNKSILSSYKNDDIICIILSGHIQVVKNDFNGNVIVIEDLRENDIFGSISANISSDEYDIITKEDTELIVLEFNNIMTCSMELSGYGIFLKNLLQITYKKITEFNNRIDILTNMTIRNKLLAYFRLMTKNNNLRFFVLPFSFSNLANYLAINRSAMSRELSLLKNEGLIEVKGRRIKLLYYN